MTGVNQISGKQHLTMDNDRYMEFFDLWKVRTWGQNWSGFGQESQDFGHPWMSGHPAHSHTHTLIHRLTHTHTHTHSQTLTHTDTHTHTHTYVKTHAHINTYSHTHTLTLSQTHTHSTGVWHQEINQQAATAKKLARRGPSPPTLEPNNGNETVSKWTVSTSKVVLYRE